LRKRRGQNVAGGRDRCVPGGGKGGEKARTKTDSRRKDLVKRIWSTGISRKKRGRPQWREKSTEKNGGKKKVKCRKGKSPDLVREV